MDQTNKTYFLLILSFLIFSFASAQRHADWLRYNKDTSVETDSLIYQKDSIISYWKEINRASLDISELYFWIVRFRSSAKLPKRPYGLGKSRNY